MLGESHAGWDKKARFLADAVGGTAEPLQPRFHASEHILADGRTRGALREYLADAAGSPGLPDPVVRFRPLLEAARKIPGQPFAVLAGGSLEPRDRDRALYSAFRESVADHNHRRPDNRIVRGIGGSYLIGANHAARRSPDGASAATTTALLESDGWPTRIVRFTVNAPIGEPIADESGETTYLPFEDARLEPLAGGAAIDLLPILNRVADGRIFHADLRAPESPFALVREAGGASIPFNTLFDYVLHLP